MQSAVALSTTCTWASSPSPASLPETVRVLSDRVTVVADLMKCVLPAHAAGTATTATTARTNTVTGNRRRITNPLLERHRSEAPEPRAGSPSEKLCERLDHQGRLTTSFSARSGVGLQST